MDVSSKFEVAVRALLVPVVHTLSLLTSISVGRLPITNSPGVPWKAIHYHTACASYSLAKP